MSESAELPEGYDWSALDRCREIFFGELEHPERVRIMLTSRFDETVKELVEDKDYAEAYSRDRPLAYALAKMIPHSDGTTTLVADIELFAEDQPHGPPEATFAHEALHVMTAERAETLSDLRLRNEGRDYGHYQDFIAIAGVACEEYRVERALWVAGKRSESFHLVQLERAAKIFYNQVRQACGQYQRDLQVFPVAKAVMTEFHALVTSSAYVAAELGPPEGPVASIGVEDDLDALVFGEPWRAVITHLQMLPAADVSAPREELDAIAIGLAELLEDWLEEIGFTIEQVDEETIEFKLLAPWQWALPGFELEGDS
jgi:hypothetical protein